MKVKWKLALMERHRLLVMRGSVPAGRERLTERLIGLCQCVIMTPSRQQLALLIDDGGHRYIAAVL